jgi:hypothetical protein
MANWSNPTLTSLYVDFLSEIKARDDDNAYMFDQGTPTNLTTNFIRWNSTNKRFEIWNGSSWDPLLDKTTDHYDISVSTLNGVAASGYVLVAHVGAGGAEHANATGSVAGFMSASDKTTFDAAVPEPTVSTLVKRDSSGNAAFAAPVAADDAAVLSTVTTHADLQTAHGAVSANTNSKMVVRDSSGRAQFSTPSTGNDAVNLTYTDANYQPLDTELTEIAALVNDDSNFIVGTGSVWQVETGTTVRASLGLIIDTDVEAVDADILRADTADTLTVGFNATENDAGTKTGSTFTPDPADGNFQKVVNGGAHTLGVPATTCSIVLQYTNDGSAGAITTSAYTLVDGDDISTVDGDDFLLYIMRVNGFTHLNVRALQ